MRRPRAALLLTFVAVAVLAPRSFALPKPTKNKHCADVQFRSAYTHKNAMARVAVRRGNVSCKRARNLIKDALAVYVPASKKTGETWSWSVDGWKCSSGGDGEVDFCTRPRNEVEATTPTPGGYWAQP
jgi:hypothetical protein